MKRSKFTVSQIMDALKRVDAGLAVPEICRELVISTATFYKWRSQLSYEPIKTKRLSPAAYLSNTSKLFEAVLH
jgi:transposase-like protein